MDLYITRVRLKSSGSQTVVSVRMLLISYKLLSPTVYILTENRPNCAYRRQHTSDEDRWLCSALADILTKYIIIISSYCWNSSLVSGVALVQVHYLQITNALSNSVIVFFREWGTGTLSKTIPLIAHLPLQYNLILTHYAKCLNILSYWWNNRPTFYHKRLNAAM